MDSAVNLCGGLFPVSLPKVMNLWRSAKFIENALRCFQ